MRALALIVLLATSLPAQSDLDQRIRAEFQQVMSLAAPPSTGGSLDEKASRARAAAFKTSLTAFLERWKKDASKLKQGKFVQAKALALAGRPAQAIAILLEFLKQYPKSPDVEEAQLSLGAAYLDVGRAAESAATYARFLAVSSQSERRHVATYYLGLARYQLGDVDTALSLVRSVAHSGIDDRLVSDAQVKLIEMLRDSGHADEASKELVPLRARYPDSSFLQSLEEQLASIGQPAPEFQNVKTWLNGSPQTLAAMKGKVVVLTFFVSWADASQEELKALSRVKITLGNDDIKFLALSKFYESFKRKSREEQVRDMAGFLKLHGVVWPCGLAEDFSNLKAYLVRGVPQTVVIGRDGRIAYVKYGASRRDQRGLVELQRAISRAVARR